MSANVEQLLRYVRAFERVRRRRWVLSTTAVSIGFGCVMLATLAVMQRRHALPVWIVWAALVGGVAPLVALVSYFKRFNLVAIAGEIERRESTFEQKLQTVVGQSLTPPRLRASDELLEQLAEDLQSRVKARPAASLVSWRPMVRAFVFALVGAGALSVVESRTPSKTRVMVAASMPTKPQEEVSPATLPLPALSITTNLEVKYPAYLTKAPMTSSGESVEAPVGSEILVKVVANRPVGDITLETEGAAIGMTPQGAIVPVIKDTTYRIKVSDAPDVKKQLKIRAIADAPPTLSITRPRSELLLAAAHVFPIAFDAADDFGIAKMTAEISISSARNGNFRALRVPVDASPLRLSMSALKARAGDVVTLTMQARDAAGQMSPAETRRIVVTSRATLPLAELREAAQAAQALGKSLELVAPQLGPNVPRTTLGRSLAAADDARVGLEGAMARLVSAESNEVTRGLQDASQGVCDGVREMRERLGAASTDAEKPHLAELVKASQQLNQQLGTFLRGETATSLQAQLKPRELAAMAMTRLEIPRTKAALRSAAARAPTLAPLITELGLDPAAANLSQQVDQIIGQGEQLAQSFRPPNPFALAQQYLAASMTDAAMARRLERRLGSLTPFVPVTVVASAPPAATPTATTRPLDLDQAPPEYREAITAYFQAISRDSAAAPK